ncbi:MAG: Uma2 family endonuclease [Opitutaceae bacterium]|nr:Uma2 family endonuclease [Cytophagales bacterium]
MVTDINQLDTSKTYFYFDYLSWQFEGMVELIRGKIVKMSPAPSDRHQVVSGNLHREFSSFLKNNPCRVFHAPYDVRLTRSLNDKEILNVVQPDICIICDPGKRDERGCNGAPDLIIEILSPATSRKDVKDKFELYEEAGVREYWIVDPLENLTDVFVLQNNKYQLVKKYVDDDIVPVNLLPELFINMKDIFEE